MAHVLSGSRVREAVAIGEGEASGRATMMDGTDLE